MTDKVKNAWLYISGFILALLGVVYVLLTRNRGLKQELEGSKAEGKQSLLKGQQQGVDTEALDAASAYQRARAEWLREYTKSNPLGAADLPKGDSDR